MRYKNIKLPPEVYSNVCCKVDKLFTDLRVYDTVIHETFLDKDSIKYDFIFVKKTPKSRQEVIDKISEFRKISCQFPLLEAEQEIWLQASTCSTRLRCTYVEALYKDDAQSKPDNKIIIQVTARLKELMYNELAFYEQDEVFTDEQNRYTFMLHKHGYTSEEIKVNAPDSDDAKWKNKREYLLNNGYKIINANLGYLVSDYEDAGSGCVVFAMVMTTLS